MGEPALRVVCYAVNGTGVGHLTRLLAIARWIRRYAAALERRIEVWFLTSSEADSLAFAEGFAAFKIPSKTIVGEAGIDRTLYRSLAKQWVWHTLGLIRPDLLLVDTFPCGSFGELIGALDLCRHKAFVYRPVRAEVAERPDFQGILPLYDLVVVPETDAAVLVPPGLEGRVVHTGPVLSRESWELLPRPVARERLGLSPDTRCVFVSAGGGGDRHVEQHIDRALASLASDSRMQVVVGTGPLYRGRPFPGVTTLAGPAAEWALAFDAAVCAAGYNTFGELMFAGVPVAFLPQDKLADDQRARARRAADAGAAIVLDASSDLREAVLALLSRREASDRARSLVPRNGARVAGAELLRLLVPPAQVDRVEDALEEEVLTRAGHTRELDVLALAPRLARGCETDLAVALERSFSLLHSRDAREVRGLVDAVVRGLPSSGVMHRADVCTAAMGELDPLAPGDGAAARAAVATGRWGGAGAVDGVALAREVRPYAESSSSSFRSMK